MTVLIGFDIGGTKCAVSVGEERDGGRNILRKRTIPTDHAIPPRLMLERLCDITVRVPERETYRVQELHLPICHALCAAEEEYFFGMCASHAKKGGKTQ